MALDPIRDGLDPPGRLMVGEAPEDDVPVGPAPGRVPARRIEGHGLDHRPGASEEPGRYAPLGAVEAERALGHLSDDQPRPVRADGQTPGVPGIVGRLPCDPTRGQVPGCDPAAALDGVESRPVWIEGHAPDADVHPFESSAFRPPAHCIKDGVTILGRGRQVIAVGAEGHVLDQPRPRLHRDEEASAPGLPDADRHVEGTGRQPVAVGA